MKFKTENIYKNEKRYYIFRLIFLFFFILLIFRLMYLQILKGDYYSNLSKKNIVRKQRIPPLRGFIFDKHGQVLATNRPAFSLYLYKPKKIKNLDKELLLISKFTNIPFKELKNKVKENIFKENIKLVHNLDWEIISKLESLSYFLPGIYISFDPVRYYPYSEITSHVVGYVQEISKEELKKYKFLEPGDFIGKFGIEKFFNKILVGTPGYKILKVDAKGKELSVLKIVDSKPGDNIYLTIDINLQKKAYELLKGKSGTIVAIDPKNGKILCMVSTPGFDPNEFAKGISKEEWLALIKNKMHPLTNKAISGEYPPGSTFKVITAISALVNKVIDKNTTVFCPGFLMFKDIKFRCWNKYGHGKVDVIKAIKESCDTFFYKIGLDTGIDNIYKTAINFGLGFKTEIALPGERSGLMPNSSWKLKRFHEQWYLGETPSCAIGQGFDLVTPLQMARVYATIANEGTLYKPLIVDKIVTPEGKIFKKYNPVVVRKLHYSRRIWKIIKTALYKVVNEPHGTAYSQRLKNFEYSGKTGTAQVRKLGEKRIKDISEIPYEQRDHAWFVAYAPSKKPKIVVAVLVEHGGHGGSGAAPLAKKLIKYYFKVKDVSNR